MAKSKIKEAPEPYVPVLFKTPFKAWHLGSTNSKFILPDGEKLIHTGGDLKNCTAGLHASYRLFSALECANETDQEGFVRDMICRIECTGEFRYQWDNDKPIEEKLKKEQKFVCSERTVLWRLTREQFAGIIKELYQEKIIAVLKWTTYPSIVVDFVKDGHDFLAKYAKNAIYDAENKHKKAKGEGWGRFPFPYIMDIDTLSALQKQEPEKSPDIENLKRYSENIVRYYVNIMACDVSINSMLRRADSLLEEIAYYDGLFLGKKPTVHKHSVEMMIRRYVEGTKPQMEEYKD